MGEGRIHHFQPYSHRSTKDTIMTRRTLTFLLTQIFSLIGSRMTGVAIGIYLYRTTGNTAPLLIAAFFAELPLMALSGWAGVLADRFERRWVIVVGEMGQAVGTVLLLISFESGQFQLWHLYSIMLFQGCFATLQSPASEAAITSLVPPDQRDRANGLRQIGFPLAGVVAPMLAGIIYSIGGIVTVVAIDLGTFLVAMTVLARIHLPRPEPSAEDEVHGADWRSGWRYLWSQRALLVLSLYLAWIFFLMNGPLTLDIPYMLARTGDQRLLGLLLGASNAGAFGGALAVMAWRTVRRRVRVMLTGYLLHGLCLMAFGMVRHPVLLGLSIFWVMFPLPLNGALYSTLLQNLTPPAMQGRLFGVTGQMFTLTTPLSFLLTGYVVDTWMEPAVGGAGWGVVAPLVGDETGAGMGLLLVMIGTVIGFSTLLVWSLPSVRGLDDTALR